MSEKEIGSVLVVMETDARDADLLRDGWDRREIYATRSKYARAAVAELIAAATNVANGRHTHSAIHSPDGGETCGVCGSNFRDTTRHFVAGESQVKDWARLRAALSACSEPAGEAK